MKITGAELIARSLVACGIDHAFNVPGLGIHPLVDALRRHKGEIRYFTAPSETGVTLMADGYGRATGKPAFVNVYHASGTALAMMGVTTAWADRSPMLFSTTTSGRRLERRDQYASVPEDITEMSRQFVKWRWEVPLVERIPEAIARAVLLASTAPMGPVHLAFPMDLYTDEIDEAVASDLLQQCTSRARTVTLGCADPQTLSEAVATLQTGQRVIIVAGGEVTQADAVDALVKLAEKTGAAVFGEPYVAYMGFPNNHAQFVGRFSPKHPLVTEADVVLVAGAELTEGGGTPVFVPRGEVSVISLVTDVRDIGKQLWPDIPLVGNLATMVRSLAQGVAAAPATAPWRSAIAEARAQYEHALKSEAERVWAGQPISMPRLAKEVESVFGDQAIIVDHSTTGTACLLQMMDFATPERYFGISARASAQGWGVPAAIGIQVARPNERVVAFAGDGGFMFTASALYAAALWRLPMVIIVLSNGGWHDVAYGAQVKRGWTEADLREVGWRLDPPIDHAGLANSLSLCQQHVREPGELRVALEAAKAADGPTVLVVETDPRAVEYYLAWLQR